MSSKVALHPQRGCSNCFVAGCGWAKAVYWILLTKCRVHLRAAIISLIELHNDQCTDVTDDALKSLYIIVVNLYIYNVYNVYTYIYNVQQWNWFHKNLNKFKNTFLQQNYNIYFIFHKVDRKTAEFSHRKKIEVSSVFKAENIIHVQLMKVQVFRNGYKSFVERYLIKSTE